MDFPQVEILGHPNNTEVLISPSQDALLLNEMNLSYFSSHPEGWVKWDNLNVDVFDMLQ
jgi:hypothetical protein